MTTYLKDSFKNGKIVRWPDNSMPISVYIAPFRWYKGVGDEYKYKDLIFQAFDIWKKASGGKLSFKFVSKLNESQINIDWKRVDRKSLGQCYFNFDSRGRMYSAEIQIGLSDGIIHQKYQDENEVFHTIIHEVGHALGLNHSPFKGDIMYVPHQYGNLNVSERDQETLKWLYILPLEKTVQEIASDYNLPSVSDIDQLISLITKEKPLSRFEEVKSSIEKIDDRDLNDERHLIAEINRYNLSLQNISISPNIEKYLKKNFNGLKDN